MKEPFPLKPLSAPQLTGRVCSPSVCTCALRAQDDILTVCDVVTQRLLELGDKVPPILVLPVYSLLPSELQAKIFDPAPDGAQFPSAALVPPDFSRDGRAATPRSARHGGTIEEFESGPTPEEAAAAERAALEEDPLRAVYDGGVNGLLADAEAAMNEAAIVAEHVSDAAEAAIVEVSDALEDAVRVSNRRDRSCCA